jgi:hypothetical protein
MMARNPNKVRIDYAPGPAAFRAIEEAAALAGPKLNKQALIDKLVLWGLWCAKKEQDRPLPLFGTNRTRWRS